MRPRRKIDIGNAAGVIQRGRDVTIIPNEGQSLEFTASDRNISRSLRYSALDVVHGSPAPNPEAISVNLSAYPGWKINQYDCIGGTGGCVHLPGTATWVEVMYALADDWVDAYLVVDLVHASIASANEFLFKVESATLVSDSSTVHPNNVSYSIASGNIVSKSGSYLWHIATTDSDGKKIMLMELREPGDYELMFDDTYIQSAGTSRGEKHSVRLHGVQRPEDHYNPLTPSFPANGWFFNYTVEAV